MAINSADPGANFLGFRPQSFQARPTDYSWIGQLPDEYQAGLQTSRENQLRQALQTGDWNTILKAFGEANPNAAAVAQMPKWEQTGETLFGQKQFGPVQVTGQGISTGNQPTGVAGTSAVTGDFGNGTVPTPDNPGAGGLPPLESQSPAFQSYVKNMIAGKVPPPQGMGMSRPVNVAAMAYASQIDPNFDATAWGARFKTRQSMTPGGAGFKAAQSAAQLANHLNATYDAALPVTQENYDYGTGPGASIIGAPAASYLNSTANEFLNVARAAKGDPRLNSLEQTKQALIHELSTNWKGTGMASDADIERWSGNISGAQNTQQLQSTAREIGVLMQDRLKPYLDIANNVPGMQDIVGQIMGPDTRKALDRINEKTQGAAQYTGEQPDSIQNTPNTLVVPKSQAGGVSDVQYPPAPGNPVQGGGAQNYGSASPILTNPNGPYQFPSQGPMPANRGQFVNIARGPNNHMIGQLPNGAWVDMQTLQPVPGQ